MADADYVQLQIDERSGVLTRAQVAAWPPPERLWLVYALAQPDRPVIVAEQDLDKIHAPDIALVCCTPFKRVSMSRISDEDAAEMTHVARGALYYVDGGDQ